MALRASAHELELYPTRRDLPFLCVHAESPRPHSARPASGCGFAWGGARRPSRWSTTSGSIRSCGVTFAWWGRVVCKLQPDILHVTGPSDVGQLGAYLGHRLACPIGGIVAHQPASIRRLALAEVASVAAQVVADRECKAGWSGRSCVRRCSSIVSRGWCWRPTRSSLRLLSGAATTGPTYLMRHGVDTAMFSPDETRLGPPVQRLAADGVRGTAVGRKARPGCLRPWSEALCDAGDYRARRASSARGRSAHWLERRHDRRAVGRGVLDRRRALAGVIRVWTCSSFPSPSDTFGLVVLEAMASGLAGRRDGAAAGRGFWSRPAQPAGWRGTTMISWAATLRLARDRALRGRPAGPPAAARCTWSWMPCSTELSKVYKAEMGHAAPVAPAISA